MPFRSRAERSGATSRRRNRWLLVVLGCLVALGLVAALIDILFIAHQIGMRTVAVDGEDVMSANGFTVRSTEWLARPQVAALLQRIQVQTAPLQKLSTRSHEGIAYVRVQDVVTLLQGAGEKASFSGNQLRVQLHANQHYAYQAKVGMVRMQTVTVVGKPVGRVLGIVHDEAAYVPAAAVAQAFTQGGLHSVWKGQALQIAVVQPAPVDALKNLANVTPIDFGAGKVIAAPALTWQGVDYVPVNSLNAALRQLGWKGTLGTWRWSITQPVPATTGSKSGGSGKSGTGAGTGAAKAAAAARNGTAVSALQRPISMGFVPFYSGDLAAYQDVMQHRNAFNAMASDAWAVNSAGDLTGSAPTGKDRQALSAGEPVYATVANIGSGGFNGKLMAAVLNNSSLSSHLQTAITELVNGEGDTGALLDLEALPASSRAAYTAFVKRLAGDLHAVGKQLLVVVPPDTGYRNESWNNAYDDAALGQAADGIIVMAYDYSYAGGKPGPIAPLPWVQQVLAYTVSQVPANHVLLGLDVYGYDWGDKAATAVSLTSVDSFISAHHIKPQWNTRDQAPWYTWTDSNGVQHTVYYENAKSTQAKLTLAQTYGVLGVAIWRAGLENASVLHTLSVYAKP